MAKNVIAICLLFLFASSVIYEVQGTFLLKMYLRRKFFPRRCRDFTPFACKGMLKLMGALQGGCPATREFKQFFVLFKSYIQFILSITSSSKSIDTEMSTKCDALAKAMTLLSGAKGGVDASSDFKETMFSMGKVLVEQKTSGSIFMRRKLRRELIVSMVKWTRTIVTLVSAAAEKRGKTIDVSSLGLDVDVNSSVGSDDESEDESPSSGSPSPKTESPKTESQNSGSPSSEKGSSSSGSATSSRSGSNSRAASGSTSKDTSSGSPTDSSSPSVPSPSVPSPSVPSDSGETAEQGTASGSGEASTKTKKSASGSTKQTATGSTKQSATEYSDATGATKGSPSESPTDSSSPSVPSPSVPSPSVPSDSGETSVKGTASGSGEASTKTKSQGTSTNSETATTSVKQVEKETSKEVMSFISSLEQKYAGKAELKVFFDKLKSSMSASSKISTTDSKDFISGMKSAVGKLSEAMVFVRSKFSKSEEMKTNMATYQAQLMKTLKELQEINSEIVTQSKGKTVTSTQQTELKQTITKWEQVTTQFVETAASSSSQSSSSQSSSQSEQSSSMTNAQAS